MKLSNRVIIWSGSERIGDGMVTFFGFSSAVGSFSPSVEGGEGRGEEVRLLDCFFFRFGVAGRGSSLFCDWFVLVGRVYFGHILNSFGKSWRVSSMVRGETCI